jgi:hypothetical protein
VLLVLGAITLGRRLGFGWPAIVVFLILLTLRHRIAKTGANSLEGYFHPRMLSFGLGLFALSAIAGGRIAGAALWVVAASIIHTTTGFWFALVIVTSGLADRAAAKHFLTTRWVLLAILGLTVATLAVLSIWPGTVMDDTWLAVLGEKDYLFPGAWPAYAWLTNLAYPVLIAATFRARRQRGLAGAGEQALVVGLLALVLLFAVSLVPTERHVALAVQLQVNRVFWVLDIVTVAYLAWWIAEGISLTRTRGALRAVIAVLLLLAIGRGVYVLRVETGRPLASFTLATNDWTRAMTWLRTQDRSWNVLADPGHAWKYGSSVRVAAVRDTLLETGKDTAFAMYDRGVALRVAERGGAISDYDAISMVDVRSLRARYLADVMVDRADRTFPLPVLYRNPSFVIYDLR